METVRFHIHRKGAFAGCTLTYRLNINGAFVGALKKRRYARYYRCESQVLLY